MQNPAHFDAAALEARLAFLTRRSFISRTAHGVGSMALASLIADSILGDTRAARADGGIDGRRVGIPHFAPKAKRVLCLFQSEGFSHIDLFDQKQALWDHAGKDLPPSIKGTQRVTGMTSGQGSFPVVPPLMQGKRCGPGGLWISDLMPHLQTVAEELCIIKSLNTEAINHDPAITLMNTGNQLPGYASMGSWASYGLGSENANLPAFIVLVSQGSGKNPGQPIFSRLWGSGFLPSSHQGVGFRPGGNPVPYLANPDGIDPAARRAMLDEMAFRMQSSVPELADLSGEKPETLEMYGPEVNRPGSYAANCLLGRRLLERGVRFVQLFHRGWDQHIAINRQLPNQCRDVDQPTAAVLKDLKARGMLEDTLVIFATEFGRTAYSQGGFGDPSSGRDHHGRCFTVWMAGGGVKRGFEYGKTDDFSYNIVENPVHVRDFHATVMHCLGIDHERLTVPFRGLDVKLTGVEPARVVREVLV
jgi:hypothetical protein